MSIEFWEAIVQTSVSLGRVPPHTEKKIQTGIAPMLLRLRSVPAWVVGCQVNASASGGVYVLLYGPTKGIDTRVLGVDLPHDLGTVSPTELIERVECQIAAAVREDNRQRCQAFRERALRWFRCNARP
jgi:hypothetical protein